jgi:DUF4097 and DUF4098 domain-containing protein YvlB
MRLAQLIPALSLPVLLVIAGCAPERGTTGPVSRETTLTFAADEPIKIRNLSGAIKLVRAESEQIEVRVTVYAESSELLEKFEIEETTDEDGILLVRMVYPLDEYSDYRYPFRGDGGESAGSNWGSLFGDGSGANLIFEDKRVNVDDSAGILLYADIEVLVPDDSATVSISNEVGSFRINAITGDVAAVLVMGDVTVENFKGSLNLDLTGGDIDVAQFNGSLTCSIVSGRVDLSDVSGESLDCSITSGSINGTDVGSDDVSAKTVSGRINIEALTTRKVKLGTVSGRMKYTADRIEVFEAESSNGHIQLNAPGEHLKSVDVDTGNGNVTLVLGPAAAFEMRTSVRESRVESRYEDVRRILDNEQFRGLARGEATTKINVDTSNGRIILQPGRS